MVGLVLHKNRQQTEQTSLETINSLRQWTEWFKSLCNGNIDVAEVTCRLSLKYQLPVQGKMLDKFS